MKQIFIKFKDFYLFYFILFLVLFGICIFIPKSESFIYINNSHNPFLDRLFIIITFLGDGKIYILLFVIMLFIRFRYALMYLMAFISDAIISQGLKNFVFPDLLRPLKYFELQNIEFHLVEGIKIYKYHSFPSGHTSTAFAVFSILALIMIPSKYRFLAVLTAFLVGYSRIYLGQHFLPDVTAGSLIGVLVATFVYWWLNVFKPLFLENRKWIDKNIVIKFY